MHQNKPSLYMKNYTISLIALFSAVLTLAPASAQQVSGKGLTAVPAIAAGLSLHNLFQSNMVLQREKPITIWGWAAAGEAVSVSFGGQTQTAKAGADRSWKVIFPAMPATAATAEPLQMTIKGKAATLTLDNILMGDVWVMGGQSNMQEPIRNLDGGPAEIVSANYPKIRLLTVPNLVDNQEKKNFPRRQKDTQPDGDWDICSPQTVPDFSGIGYIFARRIHMASQVPIGVIDASFWGTPVEGWTPLSVVKSIDSDTVRALVADWDKQVAAWDPKKQLENQIKQHEQIMAELKKQGKPSNEPPPSKPVGAPIDNQNYPGNCYASMISPIAGLAVKGAVWHQGYNNARPDAETVYYQVFPKMIAAWRAAFNDANMPFGIISQCTDNPPQNLNNYLECMMDFGIYVREAHYKTFLDFYKAGDKNIGYADSYDHRAAWWHPELKIPAGERIARWAMVTQYGVSSVSWKPSMVTKVEPKDNTLILNFDSDMASVNNEAIVGFSIAGKDGKFQPAKAEYLVTGKDSNGQPQITWKALVLSHPLVPNPIHFRFAWGRNPVGNLRMVYIKDVPLAAQRSDNWTVADMYENYTGKKSAVLGLVNGGEVEALKNALKAADLDRRIFEAQALLDSQKK
jgi:sialate O-acetylesterase